MPGKAKSQKGRTCTFSEWYMHLSASHCWCSFHFPFRGQRFPTMPLNISKMAHLHFTNTTHHCVDHYSIWIMQSIKWYVSLLPLLFFNNLIIETFWENTRGSLGEREIIRKKTSRGASSFTLFRVFLLKRRKKCSLFPSQYNWRKCVHSPAFF